MGARKGLGSVPSAVRHFNKGYMNDEEPNVYILAVKIWLLIAVFRIFQFLSMTIQIIHWPISNTMVWLSKKCERLVNSRSDMRHMYRSERFKKDLEDRNK